MKSLLVMLFATSLFAADATGRWKGELVPAGGDGTGHAALLILEQEGDAVTGTAGPDDGEQYPVRNATVKADTLTFEVAAKGSVFKFRLKIEGDEVKGDITREGEDGQKENATLTAKRDR